MVYQPQPQYGGQPQYGQPAQGYGQPAPTAQPPAYGAPAVNAAPPTLDTLKFGLPGGGQYKIPVKGFIGRFTGAALDPQSQYGLRLVEHYDQVQILDSPVPWPWATIDLSIKYSDRDSSAMGRHFASAKALGLGAGADGVGAMVKELTGKIFEMRQMHESFGEIDGKDSFGDVWRFIRIEQSGAPQSFPQPQYAQPQPATAQPVNPQVAVPMQQQLTGASLPPANVERNLTPNPSDTAAVRAKKLLNGRALNEWLGVALMDDKVKAEPAFMSSIYDQSFIVGLKASGQVIQNPDGKFQVVS